MPKQLWKEIFVNNAVAGFGLATGVYSASLVFVPLIEIVTEFIVKKGNRNCNECSIYLEDNGEVKLIRERKDEGSYEEAFHEALGPEDTTGETDQ